MPSSGLFLQQTGAADAWWRGNSCGNCEIYTNVVQRLDVEQAEQGLRNACAMPGVWPLRIGRSECEERAIQENLEQPGFQLLDDYDSAGAQKKAMEDMERTQFKDDSRLLNMKTRSVQLKVHKSKLCESKWYFGHESGHYIFDCLNQPDSNQTLRREYWGAKDRGRSNFVYLGHVPRGRKEYKARLMEVLPDIVQVVTTAFFFITNKFNGGKLPGHWRSLQHKIPVRQHLPTGQHVPPAQLPAGEYPDRPSLLCEGGIEAPGVTSCAGVLLPLQFHPVVRWWGWHGKTHASPHQSCVSSPRIASEQSGRKA